ncbi:MAG: tetratricopeptide repeat protein [Desulfobulbaceae bacterium]
MLGGTKEECEVFLHHLSITNIPHLYHYSFYIIAPQKVLAELSDEGITSFQLYQPKANQGDADAQFNLALLYYTGLGIPQDRRYAIYWYTKAAEQGHIQAQYFLGKLYNFGDGEEVRQDFKLAVYWLTKDIFRLNIYWDICMNMTMNLRRIINWLSSGIQKQRNKIIILLNRTGTRC